MSLTHQQKRYIKKNIKDKTLAQIAKNLQLKEEDISDYLKDRWKKDKYDEFKKKQEGVVINTKIDLYSFSFKEWIKTNWKQLLFLTILVFIAYVNSLPNKFVSDDREIYEQPLLDSYNYIFRSTAVLRSFIMVTVYKLAHLNPWPYRLVNILFHLSNTYFVYLLISLLSKRRIALFTAAIFAVHPILIEAVTWISGGPYSQYSFFLLLSLITYILSQKNLKLFAVSFISFSMALASSYHAVVLPLVLILYEVSFQNIKRTWKRLIPFFSVFIVGALLFLPQIADRLRLLQTNYYVQTTLQNPVIQFPLAITSYFELIFWPDKLTLYHSELTYTLYEYLFRVIIFVLFIAAIFLVYKKNKLIFFWLTFFIISLLLTLTPLGITWLYAERYAYLGSIGIFFVVSYLLNKLASNKNLNVLAYLVFISIIIGLTARTIYRNIDWRNEDNLWVATGKTSPSDPKTHNNLGDMYYRQGNYKKAIEEFSLAIKLKSNYADAYHNLANVYYRSGELIKARENYEKALSINPNIWQSYQSIAVTYFDQKQFDKAEENIKKAIAIDPNNAVLYANLAAIYMNLKEKDKAREAILKAIQSDPKNQLYKQALNSIK